MNKAILLRNLRRHQKWLAGQREETRPGGRTGIPNFNQVQNFLKKGIPTYA